MELQAFGRRKILLVQSQYSPQASNRLKNCQECICFNIVTSPLLILVFELCCLVVSNGLLSDLPLFRKLLAEEFNVYAG